MRPKSKPVLVGQLLDGALPYLREPLALSTLQRRWRFLAGDEVARRAQPIALSDGILLIGVSNSPWLQELCLRESELLDRLHTTIGQGIIRGLRLTLHSPPDEVQRKESRGMSRRAALTPAQRTEVKEAVGEIRDGELAGTVERFLRKAATGRRRESHS